MNRRPLIGITCGTSALDSHARQPQDRLNRAYSRAVALAGGVPVIVPNLEEGCEDWTSAIDGLLLSGGVDVDPALYGEMVVNSTVEVDSIRDSAELPMVRDAMNKGLPVLAICRGIQTMNVALGGSLYQDLPSQRPSTICHRQPGSRDVTTHSVSLEAGARLTDICGSREFAVNSFHHQAIRDTAPGLIVTAHAEDGVIEAVELPGERFVIGVQWHPEELVDSSAEAMRLFREFVAACSELPG